MARPGQAVPEAFIQSVLSHTRLIDPIAEIVEEIMDRSVDELRL